MDLTETLAPKSDQINADDLISGPRTFTISGVKMPGGDQPVSIYLAEFPEGRPFKPSKSMRRVMAMAWGTEGSVYVGRRLTLYRDPEIRFGKEKVGGVRISHMSHIDKPMAFSLTVTRGKRAPYRVDPLPDNAPSSPPVTEESVARVAELRAEWRTADPERRKVIEAEVHALETDADPEIPDPHDGNDPWVQESDS